MSAGSIMDLVKGMGQLQSNQSQKVNIRKVEERDQNDVIETFAHSFSETEILTSGKNRFLLNTPKYLLVSNIDFSPIQGYNISYKDCKNAGTLIWRAYSKEGFKYSMVAEIGGAFAGFYLVQDHHQGKFLGLSKTKQKGENILPFKLIIVR